MKKTLIIIRHGNTFRSNETSKRVGRGTDLPLVEEQRSRAVGKYLAEQKYVLDRAYAAPLERTLQTALLVLEEMNAKLDLISISQFSEIDYGPDENKTEEETRYRLGKDYFLKNNSLEENNEAILNQGKAIIDQWDQDGTVPSGWIVDIQEIINAWRSFADNIADNETVLLCSSNGIIRFSPHILNVAYDEFCKTYDIKVATGSVSIFEYMDGMWSCKEWNTKPYKVCK